MHKHPKLVFLVTGLAFLLATFFISHPTFATDTTDNIIETTFFGNLKDDGGGCGVYTILNLVIDILSIGVGILAIIGITIVGIKYLTAKGDIEQAKKAKTRLLQIVIGLVTYVLLYAGIQWLLPGGKLNTSQQCTSISNQELAQLKEKKRAEEAAKKAEEEKSSAAKDDAACLKNAAKVVKEAGICKQKTAAQRVLATAKLLAWPKGTSENKYKYDGGNPTKEFKSAREEVLHNEGNWNAQTRKGASCLIFTSTVARASGVDKNFPPGNGQFTYKSNKFQKKTCQKCVPYNNSQPGDIVLYYDSKWGGSGHALIRGDGVVYEANFHGKKYAHVGGVSILKKEKAFVIVFHPKD